MTTASSPSLAFLSQHLTQILGGLRLAVATRAARDPAVVPLLTLLWTRLNRMALRFEALVARVVAGRCGPGRTRGPRAARTARREAGGLRLPTSRDWLIRLLPHEAAGYRGQLVALLATPEMAALLAAAPNAGRILRPLYRILSIDPAPPLYAAVAPRPPAPVRPASRRPARKRVGDGSQGDRPSAISQLWALFHPPAPGIVAEPPERETAWRNFDMSR